MKRLKISLFTKLKPKLIALFSVLFLSFLIIFLVYKEGALPVNKNDRSSKIFVIQKGESLANIAKNLENEELIRNRLVFYIIVVKLGIEKKIQAGDFRLSPSMNAYQIAQALTHGTLDVWVTIVEGLRKEEIAQIFSRELNIPETEFLKYAKEGYLFPDTYLMPRQATAGAVTAILNKNFADKYIQGLRNKALKKGLTDEEVIVLASLVEKEAKYDEDRQKVASIILKRLKNDWPLQIDATIQYALGFQTAGYTWWKKVLSNADKDIDSPYNTYKNEGLPPTPIANPGIAAIKAVVNANDKTPYWYYLSDSTGVTHYAVTLEEHNANIKKYLR